MLSINELLTIISGVTLGMTLVNSVVLNRLYNIFINFLSTRERDVEIYIEESDDEEDEDENEDEEIEDEEIEEEEEEEEEEEKENEEIEKKKKEVESENLKSYVDQDSQNKIQEVEEEVEEYLKKNL